MTALPRPAPRRDVHCPGCSARRNSVFCVLNAGVLGQLDSIKSVHVYSKGQVIFYEGTPALGVHCIYSGQVKLYKSSDKGNQPIQVIAKSGDTLGYQALFADLPYPLNAEAMEETTVCFIGKDAFFDFVHRNPPLSLRLIQALSQEVISFEDKLMEIVDKPADARMARLILMLAETYGQNSSGGRIGINLSRQEMADMIATTPETAVRILSAFKKKAFIRFEGKALVILNPNGLLKAARLSSTPRA